MSYKLRRDFAEYLYSRLPAVYQKKDERTQLKRYIESIVEGGFDPTLNEIMGIMNLINVDTCPSKYLPMLCDNFGLTYAPDIDEQFQRKYLKNIVEIFRRKGTKSIINFIAREITGFSSDVVEMQNKMFRTWSDPESLARRGIILSKTFKVWNDKVTYYAGSKTRPGVVAARLSADFSATETTFREQVLERYLKDLTPANIKIILQIITDWGDEPFELFSSKVGEDFDRFILPERDDEIYIPNVGIEYLNMDIDILASVYDTIRQNNHVEDGLLLSIHEAIHAGVDYTKSMATTLDDIEKWSIRMIEDYTKNAEDDLELMSITMAVIDEIRSLIRTHVDEWTVDYQHLGVQESTDDFETDKRWRQSVGEDNLLISISSIDDESREAVSTNTTETDGNYNITIQDLESSSTLFVEEPFDSITSLYPMSEAKALNTAKNVFNAPRAGGGGTNSATIGGAGAKTIEVIVSPTADTADWDRIVQRANGDSNGWSIRAVSNRFLGQIRAHNEAGFSDGYNAQADSLFDTSGNIFYHVILTYDGATTPKLYVDGVVQTGSADDGAGDGGGNVISFNHRANNESQNFAGKYQHIAIWDKYMTQAEITARVGSPELTGLESNLLAYYDFKEGTGTTVADKKLTQKATNLDFSDDLTGWQNEAWCFGTPNFWSANTGLGVSVDREVFKTAGKSIRLNANRTTQYFVQIVRGAIMFNQATIKPIKFKVSIAGKGFGSDYTFVQGGAYVKYMDGSDEWNPQDLQNILMWRNLGDFDWIEKEMTFVPTKTVEFINFEIDIADNDGVFTNIDAWVDNVVVSEIDTAKHFTPTTGAWETTPKPIEEWTATDSISYRDLEVDSNTAPVNTTFTFSLVGVTMLNSTDNEDGTYGLTYELVYTDVTDPDPDKLKLVLKHGATVLAESQEITVRDTEFVLTEVADSNVSGTVTHLDTTWVWQNFSGTITFV